MLFGEFLESVRKNVECLFGLLKARFRFLAGNIEYHGMRIIGDAFKTACILHNMLLLLDGYDISLWDLGNPEDFWDAVNSFGDGEVIDDDDWAGYIATSTHAADNNFTGTTASNDDDNAADDDIDLERRPVLPKEVSLFDLDSIRNALIIIFAARFKLGQIQWPKSMKEIERTRYGMPRVGMMTSCSSSCCLFVCLFVCLLAGFENDLFNLKSI